MGSGKKKRAQQQAAAQRRAAEAAAKKEAAAAARTREISSAEKSRANAKEGDNTAGRVTGGGGLLSDRSKNSTLYAADGNAAGSKSKLGQ